MTYLELINSFWKKHNQKHFDANETLFYFFLLNECNARLWLNPFQLKTSYIEESLDLGRKAIANIRLRLAKRGLISSLEGKAKRPTVYLIREQDFTNTNYKKKDFKERQNKSNVSVGNIRETLESNVSVGNIRETLDEKTPILYNKTIKNISENNICVRAQDDNADIPFHNNEDAVSKFPTLEEVRSYFHRLRAHERIVNWEVEAERFFYHFDALGWRNGSGILIVRWESQASKWIINCEQDEHKQRTTTNQRGDASKGVQSKLPPKPGYGLIEPDDDC